MSLAYSPVNRCAWEDGQGQRCTAMRIPYQLHCAEHRPYTDRPGDKSEACGDPSNPFRDLRDDTHQIFEAMLYDLQASSDDGDQVADWIDQWRAARGEAGMADWRWWIGGTDDEIYALDFATRDEAIAAAPRAHAHGDINSFDGQFRIVAARCWDDNLDEGKDEIPFADRRNAETLPFPAGGDQ